MFCPNCDTSLRRDEKRSTNIVHYVCTNPHCQKKFKSDQTGPMGQGINLQEEQ